jgi:hypothetical protein
MNPEKAKMLEELKQCLIALEEIARTLQKALLSRNAEIINRAVEQQEEMLFKISPLIEALKTADNESGINSEEQEIRSGLRNMVSKIKKISHTNYAMAGIYLEIISKTLSEVARNNQEDTATNVYNQYGKLPQNAAPILVEDRG